MDFAYEDYFGRAIPDAYERLLHDAINGDSTLFTRGDEVEAAWGFIDSVFDAWHEAGDPQLATYPAGSWGPTEAEVMLAADKNSWRNTEDGQTTVRRSPPHRKQAEQRQ